MLATKHGALAFKVENACKEWDGKPLFESVSFELSQGEKVALFGKNGVGKTSLLNAIMGKVELDGGTMQFGIPLSDWGWLEQDLKVDEDVALLDFVRSGNTQLGRLADELERITKALESTSSPQVSLDGLLKDYARTQEQFEAMNGYAFETEVEVSLTRLQLPREVWQTPYRSLSGGQKTRAQLARLMVRRPSALVLDEPTNHLDQETLVWLEGWLQDYEGAVLFVTHDRTFMDHVAHAVVLLTSDGCRRYKGGYSDFKAARDLEIQTQTALYERQERERQDLLEAIHRYQQWYQQAHDAAGERNPYLKKRAAKNATRFKAKERALERLESRSVDKPLEGFKAQVEFENVKFEARTLVSVKDTDVSFGDRRILRDVTLEVERRHRIAIIGRNGAGKTTLLKTLTGELEGETNGNAQVTGERRHHPELRIGYFEQELMRQDANQTILDTLLRLPGMTQSLARTILAGFLFRLDDVFKPIGALSMGERCRVAFVQLYLSGANLLVLDEPTNYLDVDTRERVEEALLDYPGALMLVTHDTYLLRKVANRIVVIEDGSVRVFDGSYDEYEASRNAPQYKDLDTENQIRQLELALTQLVSEEEPEGEEEKLRLTEQVVGIRKELNRLRSLASDYKIP